MKKIKCEMCGGTDLIKENGVFVCENCGTKYSVEEAKKMMVEGVVEVKGKVKIDKEDSISNYLTMANNAYDASNYQEAENYCNKVIEIDLNHYEAWLLKGKAAGWQSTVGNKRFAESISCFINAIKKSPEDKKKEVADNSVKEIINLADALVATCCGHFIDIPDADNAKSILDNSNVAIDSISKVMLACTEEKILVNVDDLTNEELEIMHKVKNAVDNAWVYVLRDFAGDDGRPNHYDYDRYLERARACYTLAEFVAKTTINTFQKKIDEKEIRKTFKITKIGENKEEVSSILEKTLKTSDAENIINGDAMVEISLKQSQDLEKKLEGLGVEYKLENVGPTVIIEDAEIKEFVIDTCKGYINMRTHYMNSCCYKKEYNQYGSYWAVDQTLTNEAKGKCVEAIKEFHNKIHDLDPTYVVPGNVAPASNGSGVGCVVAIIIGIIIFIIIMNS